MYDSILQLLKLEIYVNSALQIFNFQIFEIMVRFLMNNT